MIFNKEYFEKVFEKGGWDYSTCEYERVKYLRQINVLQQHYTKPEHILEIGCGEGIFTLMMLQAFPGASITCVDISSTALKMAAENCRCAGNANFMEADIIEIFRQGSFPAKEFDIIVQSECLYYLFPKLVAQRNLVGYFKNLSRCLRDGGIFLTSNGVSITTRYLLELYYAILKLYCALEYAAEYREWNDFRGKDINYDLKVFRRKAL